MEQEEEQVLMEKQEHVSAMQDEDMQIRERLRMVDGKRQWTYQELESVLMLGSS